MLQLHSGWTQGDGHREEVRRSHHTFRAENLLKSRSSETSPGAEKQLARQRDAHELNKTTGFQQALKSDGFTADADECSPNITAVCCAKQGIDGGGGGGGRKAERKEQINR